MASTNKHVSKYISNDMTTEEKLDNIKLLMNEDRNTNVQKAACQGRETTGAQVTRDNFSNETSINNFLGIEKKSARDSNISRNVVKRKIVKDKNPNNNKPTFTKRPCTTGVSGHLYETKLLSLILLRAQNYKQIQNFILGSNIANIGDIDDICLRYQMKGGRKPVVLFVQAKHRDNAETSIETINVEILRKYFETYFTILDQFQTNTEDPMFEGNIDDVECYFVLYSSAKNCLTKKKFDHNLSETVHDLINTNIYIKGFQYDSDEKDIEYLTKLTVVEQLKKLGTVFLEFIMSKEYKPNILLKDKRMTKYHVLMAREMLQPCKIQTPNKNYRWWEFRSDFFESNNEYLVALRKTFFKELSTKRCGQFEIGEQERDDLFIFLDKPCVDTISKVIGKLVTYNFKTQEFKLEENLSYTELFTKDELYRLKKRVSNTIVLGSDINKAITKKLSDKFKLPLLFGNIDMYFRGDAIKIRRRIEAVAAKLMNLIKINKNKRVYINDDTVGPNKAINQSIININGGIGSAVGNLLVFDADTKMLKFQLDSDTLPEKAALFLKVLEEQKEEPINEMKEIQLCEYRFMINIKEFPKDTFEGDENDKKIARDFLSKLWIYFDQAKQDKVDEIVISDIEKYYRGQKENNEIEVKIDSRNIFLEAQNAILNWWLQRGKVPYLTHESDFFQWPQVKYTNDIIHNAHNLLNEVCSRNTEFTIQHPAIVKNFKTEISKLINTQRKLTNTVEKIKIENLEQTIDSSTKLQKNHQNHNQYVNSEKYLQHKDLDLFAYKKRETSGMNGYQYETKLLALILARTLNDDEIEDFFLGNNIADIGHMDDICLRYRVRGRQKPVILFLQARYVEDTQTKNDIQRPPREFYLQKCFDSYLKIKHRFQSKNKDLMFEGNFDDVDCNLIVYTPAKDWLTKKIVTSKVNKKVNYLLQTNQNTTNVFQYKYDEKDIDNLTNIIIKQQLNELGSVFLRLIITDKIKPIKILSNKLIARYHVALGREVLEPCTQQTHREYRQWKFRSDFFENTSENITILKKRFTEELTTKYFVQSKIDDEDRENIRLFLNNPCAFTISKLIGKLATYGNINETLQLKKDPDISMDEFKALTERFRQVKICKDVINEAVKTKLLALVIELPLSFGNLDTTIRDNEVGAHRRIELAETTIKLPEINKNDKIININDDDGLHMYRIKVISQDIPKTSFDAEEYDKKEARDFFNKFFIYTEQAKVNEVQSILETEINNYYLRIYLNDKKKWTIQVTESPYLKRFTEIFERAKSTYYWDSDLSKDVYDLLLTVINYMFIAKTYLTVLKFYQRLKRVETLLNREEKQEQVERIMRLFCQMSCCLFKLFDPNFDQSIYFEYSFDCEQIEFSLEIHPEMEWVLLKMSQSGSRDYVRSKSGPGIRRMTLDMY